MPQKNAGTVFENAIKSSCPPNVLMKKLHSPASGWSGGKQSKFTKANECDFLAHDENTGIFYGLELKSTKEPSMTFWREDIEKEHPGTNFVITKRQILALTKWARLHKGVYGFFLNFREKNNATFFVSILSFRSYTDGLEKKCINIDDVKAMGGIEIANQKLKVNYRYDLDKFFKEMGELTNAY